MKLTHEITTTDISGEVCCQCVCGWNVQTRHINAAYKMAFGHLDKSNE